MDYSWFSILIMLVSTHRSHLTEYSKCICMMYSVSIDAISNKWILTYGLNQHSCMISQCLYFRNIRKTDKIWVLAWVQSQGALKAMLHSGGSMVVHRIQFYMVAELTFHFLSGFLPRVVVFFWMPPAFLGFGSFLPTSMPTSKIEIFQVWISDLSLCQISSLSSFSVASLWHVYLPLLLLKVSVIILDPG